MSPIVNIVIKNDYYAYITTTTSVMFDLIRKSFTRTVRKYNNWWKVYENKVNKHYTLINNGKVIKVKAGLIDFLVESFKERNIEYKLVDERQPAKIKNRIVTQLSDKVKLRDYQEDAVDAVFEHPYSCIQLVTGSGKTECSASIIRSYFETYKDRAVLYVVPTIKLQKEAEERFIRYGIKCNTQLPLVGGNVANIITYMALVRSNIPYQDRDKIGALIEDECQHLKGAKFSKIVHNYKKLNLCVGISATVTPDIQYKTKLNQLNDTDFSILGATGKPVYWKAIKQTINEGYVTPVKVTVLENKEVVPLTAEEQSDWHSIKRNVLMSPNRADLVAQFVDYICKQNNYYTLMLLIPEVVWSKQFMLAISQHGNNEYRYILMFGQDKYSEIINGQLVELTTKEKKDEAYAAIKNPNIKTVFSATSFAYEGLDIPNLQALINVYGGRSDVRIKQQLGRLTRLFKGKDVGNIYEIRDNHPICESQLKKRLNIYHKEYKAEISKSDFGWWENS